MSDLWKPSRRSFLKGSAAIIGSAGLSAGPISTAFGATFPDRNLKVVVPTREGGGADRLLRAVSGTWKNYLNGASVEAGFFPGASGRVGYEVYMNKYERDAYSLIFGNMGPEVLNWAVKAPKSFKFPGDYKYISRVDSDPCVLFVSAKSKFKSIDDVIAEGKKRTLSVATSRLAHPASIGCLALGDKSGAKFNLIPLSGGKKTKAGVATGETDIGVLTSGTVIASGKTFRTLLVFHDVNPVGARLNNAPTMNDAFGTKLPPMLSSRAFGIHTETIQKHPDRVAFLTSTLDKVLADPDFKTNYIKTKAPWEYVNPGGEAECAKYVEGIFELGTRYKSYLTGGKKK